MRRLAYTASLLIAAIFIAPSGAARAQQQYVPTGVARAPFTATLSNNTPLAFGMDVETVSRALQEPLSYLRGPPGGEIYLAHRNLGGSGVFNHHDRLYLQFRNGRLAGWKGDWGHNWMWQ
jgi:glucose/arabinose dehydrogenase